MCDRQNFCNKFVKGSHHRDMTKITQVGKWLNIWNQGNKVRGVTTGIDAKQWNWPNIKPKSSLRRCQIILKEDKLKPSGS